MRRDTMYNLNLAGIGAASGSNLLSVAQGENSCTTPRTPEILNSLIAMSNPFDSYRGGSGLSSNHGPRLASSPPSGSDTNSTCSSGSPSCTSPPSVQLTCSKLIKEGLRHTLQTKRRNNSVSSDAQLSSIEDGGRTCKSEELTPEDEERRRRRRERNKIAATKCRMKKRERTVNLVQESEILETQNHDLKSQIQELEIQRKRLVDMLSGHRPSCKQAVGTASASNFSATEQQTYHHLESAGSCSRSSSTVETMVYQRVNICNHPAAAAVTMESASTSSSSSSSARLSYRRVEVSATDYQRPPPESHTPHDATPYDESTTAVRSPYDTTTSPYSTAVQSPYEPNYQAAYQEELPKDEEVWRSGSGASLNTQFGRVSNSDSGVYSCQQSLSSGMNSPMPFLQSDDGDSPFSRTPSGIFSRPTSLDVVSSDYDSNAEIIDSPTIPPPLNYRHYDTADSAYYVPPNRGGCIS